MSQVRPGVLIATIVFAAFAAYAFLAPATYRTSALLVVDAGGAGAPANLPEPLEAARRLSEAILDRSMLERLSAERAGSAAPEARAAAAASVRESLDIATSDGRTFSIGYRDIERDRVQRVCNDLARHAAELALQVLRDRSAENAQEAKRQQLTQELATFLALHPEAAAEAPSSGERSPDKDPALSAFYAEKSSLERRIQDLLRGHGTDNPYVDASESDPNLLRRRLAEINVALKARREALSSKAPDKGLSPELRATWKHLLDAVTTTNRDGAEPAASLTARIVSIAPKPSSPIDPNRPLLLFFGVVFGVGLGAAFTLVVRAAQQRRTKSSRPPVPASVGAPPQTVRMPPAPPVPSDLGPQVPSFQPPRQPDAAPIIPVPQRAISSAPPGPTVPVSSEAERRDTEPKAQPSSHPPRPTAAPRRFASTLVLPPAENPVPSDERTPQTALASAAQAWDEQIRAHAVPGFAVVRPPSEPPAGGGVSSNPPAPGAYSHSVAQPEASLVQVHASPAPRSARSPNAMKVTQPLGSFLPDLSARDPIAAERVAQLQQSRSPVPARPPASPSTPPVPAESRYSYVSSSPPPENTVTNVMPAQGDWAADPSLTPALRRPVCEQLYPLAVEISLVLVVVGVPDASEQKSRVAAELALALAESGHPRVLLMDGDLQSPRVHRLMHVEMPMTAGFSQQLRNRATGGVDGRWTVVSCQKSLHVLGEGLLRSPGLLLSKQFSQGIAELRNYYDFIVIDGPSESLGVESQALDAVVDGVIFVSGKQESPLLARVQGMFGQKRFKTVVSSP